MSDYLIAQARKHKVKHEFSGKRHFFKVMSCNGGAYDVSIEAICPCRYQSVEGTAKGEICSHILSAMMNIIDNNGEIGNIGNIYDAEYMSAMRKAENIRLVRQSNRQINTIRVSSGESIGHQKKKIEICKALSLLKKDFMTEAIFETGGRADVFNLEDGIIYEIVCSESDESIENKRKTYPEGIKIEVIRA